MLECKSNWSLSFSDHAAIKASFDLANETKIPRSRIVRLDPTLAKDPNLKVEIIEGVEEMMATVPSHWSPHMKLDVLKVTIRTVVEKIQANRKRTELNEEEMLNDELETAISELGKGGATIGQQPLIDYIEDLRVRKSILVEEKGKRLAERLGTKWYNEGEKSNRYFMRLMNRANPDKFTKIINSTGEELTDETEIESEIVNYYKELYETIIENTNDDDFFQEIDPIDEEEDSNLCRDIEESDLRTTLLSCQDSAPGPDGIPYSLIGLVWSTFGPILTAAWKYSLETRSLPQSHKVSYLKLIPKAGKSLDKLTNWRPITLSNCDHKLITKTYARRLSEKLASKLGQEQTAYLKGRLINDNLRAMLATVQIANDEDLNGLIVALDAKKAFDSVSHNYIKCCLRKFGCNSFIPVFKTLYSELRTDILINGRIVEGFNIRRGVKQGDALSCILFIMCMEPLLRNIKRNPTITPLFSTSIGVLPKTYAYADDVSATINDDTDSIKGLFKEYERLTKMSGLELNADKTELMRIGQGPIEKNYDVLYQSKIYRVKSSESMKLNGIIFHRDMKEVTSRNVKAAISKMDLHFKQWARRSLSTLGKILISKTFGISQIVYLMQTIKLNENDFKLINATLYKYIWNRNYYAAKAPERVKREIVNKPIMLGGLGMLNVAELDASLKIKAIGRFLESQHPFLELVKNKLDLTNYFEPKLTFKIEGVLDKGVELLKQDREKVWTNPALDRHVKLMNVIGHMNIKDVVSRQGQNSLAFYVVSRQARTVKDLNEEKLKQLERFIDKSKFGKLQIAVNLNLGMQINHELSESYFVNNISKQLAKCTSKEIRTARANNTPITSFKVGIDISERLFRVNKLTSTKHKMNILKVAHGDVYTKLKLFKYGLTLEDKCSRCNETENLQHKIYSCEYTKRIWKAVCTLTGENLDGDPIPIIMGATLEQNYVTLAIKAEIVGRILGIPSDQSYLIHPKHFVKLAIKSLIKKERNQATKEALKDILGTES